MGFVGGWLQGAIQDLVIDLKLGCQQLVDASQDVF